MPCTSNHILVIIASNRVEFLLEDINKSFPCGFCPIYFRQIFGMPLVIVVPPIFDMEEGLKECEGEIFVGDFLTKN